MESLIGQFRCFLPHNLQHPNFARLRPKQTKVLFYSANNRPKNQATLLGFSKGFLTIGENCYFNVIYII